MDHFNVTLIKDRNSPAHLNAIKTLQEKTAPALAGAGINTFGVFAPLLGLASNECYLVTQNSTSHTVTDQVEASGLEAVEQHDFVPTARPLSNAPRSKPGIYVFRWFDVRTADIAEIVRLSEQAWITFEGGFDTEVQALFREPDNSRDTGKMLLITQYTDLSVWEASRMPAPEARENFLARARLTLEARPIATRLVI